jgi:PEGA domain
MITKVDNMPIGNASINSNPQGATLCIDVQPVLYPTGEKVKTPVIITDIPAGLRRFAFHLPGYYRECITVNIIENQTIDIFVEQIPK